MKPKVYVETSVVSYLAARPSRDAITSSRQAITRRWWETERERYPSWCRKQLKRSASGAIRGSPSADGELARLLIVPGAIPESGPDAVHIAAAAVEECEFLLTWNFRHIANVRIRREVERIPASHGYTKTTICTPEELV